MIKFVEMFNKIVIKREILDYDKNLFQNSSLKFILNFNSDQAYKFERKKKLIKASAAAAVEEVLK